MASYLARLRDRLGTMGVDCPVLLMTSGGGLTTLENAMQFRSGLSNPVLPAGHPGDQGCGGDGPRQSHLVRYGRHHGEDLPDRRLPPADRARIRSRPPSRQGQRLAAPHPGHRDGGDRRWRRLDRTARFLGRITIDPDSAGADPGPAAYGRGGDRPTITDADVALGKIDPQVLRAQGDALSREIRGNHHAGCRVAPRRAGRVDRRLRHHGDGR